MKIFLPFKRDVNPYLDEIEKFSEHHFVYSFYKNYNSCYPIVYIHWPEALFNWIEPTGEDLEELKSALIQWKKNSIIIYTKHDEKSHIEKAPNFAKLINLIERNAHVFIHLGNNSKKSDSARFPLAFHEVVNHPLYLNSYEIIEQVTARKKLGIDEDALVITAPGKIRTFQERKLLLSSYKKLKIKNKILIVPTMKSEIRYEIRGRVRIKKFIDVRKHFIERFKKKYCPPNYIFGYGRISKEELALKVSAADIVFVPRVNTLNSGIVFLGLTFKKIVVGPSTGNIGDHLNKFGYPVFNAKVPLSSLRAIEAGIEQLKKGYKIKENDLQDYYPEEVAKNIDFIFNKYLLTKYNPVKL